MKLFPRFSTPPPIMSRQFTFTILSRLKRGYARYANEFASWKQEGPSHPFTKKMIFGGALIGMCTGGVIAARHIRKNHYRNRKGDIMFGMFQSCYFTARKSKISYFNARTSPEI